MEETDLSKYLVCLNSLYANSIPITKNFDPGDLTWADTARESLDMLLKTTKMPGKDAEKAVFTITGHAQTESNKRGELTGWFSDPLTENGIDYAMKQDTNANALVVSSDLPRAIEHALAKYCSHKEDVMQKLYGKNGIIQDVENETKNFEIRQKTYNSLVRLALENNIIPTPLLRAQYFGSIELFIEKFEKDDKKDPELRKQLNEAIIDALRKKGESEDEIKEKIKKAETRKDIIAILRDAGITESENYMMFFNRSAYNVFTLVEENNFKNVDIVGHSGFFDIAAAYYRHKENPRELHIIRTNTPKGRGQVLTLKLDKDYKWLNDPELFRPLITSQTEKIKERRKNSLDSLVQKGKRIVETPLAAKNEKKGAEGYEKSHILLEEALNSNDVLLILGDGGQGKSILATEIVSMVNTRFENGEKNIGIFVHSEELPRDPDNLDSYFAEFVKGLPAELIEEYPRLTYVIDGFEALSDSYKKPLIDAVMKLAEKNKVILTSRYLGFGENENSNSGFRTLQIDADAVAKDLDSFLEGRLDEEKVPEFKKRVQEYDPEVVGSFQNLFFLLELYKNPQDVRNYLTDDETLKLIEKGQPLSEFQLMNAKDDLMLGKYVTSKIKYMDIWGDYEQIKKIVRATKRHMDEMAFQEMTGLEPKHDPKS